MNEVNGPLQSRAPAVAALCVLSGHLSLSQRHAAPAAGQEEQFPPADSGERPPTPPTPPTLPTLLLPSKCDKAGFLIDVLRVTSHFFPPFLSRTEGIIMGCDRCVEGEWEAAAAAATAVAQPGRRSERL